MTKVGYLTPDGETHVLEAPDDELVLALLSAVEALQDIADNYYIYGVTRSGKDPELSDDWKQEIMEAKGWTALRTDGEETYDEGE